MSDSPVVSRLSQVAVVQTRYGLARDVLATEKDLPLLPLKRNQVRIEIHAASINPIDWQMIEGNRSMIARRQFPFVPLFDIAGVVTAVHGEVTRLQVGDAVHTDNKIDGGGAAAFVRVDEALVSLKPASMSFIEAAALPLAGQTALLAFDAARIGPGASVAIVGASGGVGSLVVQIAKAHGAHVIGVCSGKNADFVLSLGADETIDYESTDLRQAVPLHSLDAVVDCVGGRKQWIAAKTVLINGGRFVTICRDEDGKVTILSAIRLVSTIFTRQFVSRFGRRIQYLPVFLNASHQLLDRVNALVIAGKLRVPIAAVYNFGVEEIVAALDASKAGRTVGKLVIQVKL